MDGHREVVRLGSAAATAWLTRDYFKLTGLAPKHQPLSDATATLSAIARYEGPEASVHVRVAAIPGGVAIDLGRADWSAITVTADEWCIEARPSVYFRRPRGLRPLPTPEHSSDLGPLESLLNVTDAGHRRLVIAWITWALCPFGPYPVLVLNGEQGSAKSTATRMLRALTDPNRAPLRGQVREELDLIITANNSWVVTLDNMSGMSPWLSDALCRLATGGGFGKRQLYTDDEEILFDVQRPVIINGIDEITYRGDLLDRAVIITLPVIAEEQRRPESEVWAAFDTAAPELFGGMLDTIVAGLKMLPSVHLNKSPRMADFAAWGDALEAALGWPEGSFLAAYDENRRSATASAIEGDSVATAIMEYIDKRPDHVFHGRASALLSLLTGARSETALRQELRAWPATPAAFSRRLRRIAPLLRQHGLDVVMDQREGAESQRVITITLVDERGEPVGRFPFVVEAPDPENIEHTFSAATEATLGVVLDALIAEDMHQSVDVDHDQGILGADDDDEVRE